MSLTVEQKRTNYLDQNHGGALTIAQERQLRKTATRLAHEENHRTLRAKQAGLRARFREWMSGVR